MQRTLLLPLLLLIGFAASPEVIAQEETDHDQVVRELLEAAEQGLAEAQVRLGRMYGLGEGVPKDHKEAVKWFRKAAEQGHADAQNILGLMYANGEGVPEDYIKAYMWMSLAKAQGEETAAGNMDIIKIQMTPAQIAKAQELATEWWEEHNN